MKLTELEDIEFKIGKLIVKPNEALAIKIISQPDMDKEQVMEMAHKYLRKVLPGIKKIIYFDDAVELTVIKPK
jgi:hypothetical protein